MQYENEFRNNDDLPPDCILCAAGASSRMGDWKPLLPWKDSTLVECAVRAALDVHCSVILVTGKRSEEMEALFRDWPNVRVVRNEAWESGLVSSVRLGASLVRSPRFFVAHADMPLVDADLYRALLGQTSPDTLRPIAWRPRFGNTPGHPVLFDSSALPLIASAPDGDSLKGVFSGCDLHFLDRADNRSTFDLDDTGSYLAELAHSGRNDHGGEMDFIASERGALLVTGARATGKSTLVRRYFFGAVALNLRSLCISQVQTGRLDDGRSTGFDMEMMASYGDGSTAFSRLPLARLAIRAPFCFSLELGPYRFDPSVFVSALSFVEDFLGRIQGGPFFVALDEIGKLEFQRGEGLLPVLERVVKAGRKCRESGASFYPVFAAQNDTLGDFCLYLERAGIENEIEQCRPH